VHNKALTVSVLYSLSLLLYYSIASGMESYAWASPIPIYSKRSYTEDISTRLALLAFKVLWKCEAQRGLTFQRFLSSLDSYLLLIPFKKYPTFALSVKDFHEYQELTTLLYKDKLIRGPKPPNPIKDPPYFKISKPLLPFPTYLHKKYLKENNRLHQICIHLKREIRKEVVCRKSQRKTVNYDSHKECIKHTRKLMGLIDNLCDNTLKIEELNVVQKSPNAPEPGAPQT
jgi:hypothetical protein